MENFGFSEGLFGKKIIVAPQIFLDLVYFHYVIIPKISSIYL